MIQPIYLDYNATTPIDPEVADEMKRIIDSVFGNPSSAYSFGHIAKQAVEKARAQVAALINASPDEIVFTSCATESNNLAILGLAPFGEREGRRHIVSTQIEPISTSSAETMNPASSFHSLASSFLANGANMRFPSARVEARG